MLPSHKKKVLYSPGIIRHKRNVQKLSVTENEHPQRPYPGWGTWPGQQLQVAISVDEGYDARQERGHGALDPLPEGVPAARERQTQVQVSSPTFPSSSAATEHPAYLPALELRQ